MKGWMDGRVDEIIDGLLNRWMYGRIVERVDEWENG